MDELIRGMCAASFIAIPLTVAYAIYLVRGVEPVTKWRDVPIVALVLHVGATLCGAAIIGWIYLAWRLFS